MNKQPRSILIIRLKSIGEVVMSLSALEAVHRRWPDAAIDFIVEPPHEQLLEADPRIRNIHLFDKKTWRSSGLSGKIHGFMDFARRLRSQHYDAVIDLHGIPRSQWLARLARSGTRAGRSSRHFSDRFFDHLVSFDKPGRHNVALNLEVCSALGTGQELLPPRLFVPDSARGPVHQWLEEKGLASRLLIGFHPGTSSPDRLWPAERFVELGRLLQEHLGAGIAVTAGPEEKPLAGRIAREIGGKNTCVASADHLLHLAALLEKCAVFVACDTGPLHMAAALGTPVAGLYGSSSPLRSGPLGSGHMVFHKELECSPCGGKVFSCEHKECFRSITVQEVFDQLCRHLENMRQEHPSGGSGETMR